MGSPQVESFSHLVGVGGPMVYPRNTRLMAGDVVQHRFDDVRQDAQLAHAGRHCPADIVKPPGLHLHTSLRTALVERRFCLAPALEATLTLAEHERAAIAPGH